MSGNSSRLEQLIEAAKHDGPTPESRIAMWTGIQTAASLSAGAGSVGGSAFGAAKAALVSSKLVLGLVLGASLTVGVAGAFVAFTVSQPSFRGVQPHALATPRALARTRDDDRGDVRADTDVAPNAATVVLITGHLVTPQSDSPLTHEQARAQTKDDVHNPPATVVSEQDRLAGEARMVREARGALHRGDPDLALRIVRAARTQPGARMVPEELTVEAQVLRAMGDEAGAKQVDADLANRFPAHTLTH
jgi:hypothetical protein